MRKRESLKEMVHRMAAEKCSARSAIGSRNGARMADAAGTGTVIVAIRYQKNGGGIVIGADRQCSAGHAKSSVTMEKIVQLSDFSAVGNAGSVRAIQDVIDVYGSTANRLRIQGGELPIETQVNLFHIVTCALTVPTGSDWDFDPYICVETVFAGFDTERRIPWMVKFDTSGCRFDRFVEPFAVAGSGTPNATGALEALKSAKKKGKLDNITQAYAIALLFNAIHTTGRLDMYVGETDLYPPMIAVIDKRGYRELESRRITQIVRRVKL